LSPFKVTQKFKANPTYYKQFGLLGHEGLDIVPTGKDISIFSLLHKGKVVKDIDMEAKGGAYGNHCTIWYPDIGEAWMYCHLNSNTVFLGQEIEPSYYLGQMGSTGNTTGPHLHLNRFKVTENGVRLNKNNGYLGGIDPLPYLEETEHRLNAQTVISSEQADDEKRALDVLRDAFKSLKIGPNSYGNLEGMVRDLVEIQLRYNAILSGFEKLKQERDQLTRIKTDLETKLLLLSNQKHPTPILANFQTNELLKELLGRIKNWINGQRTKNME